MFAVLKFKALKAKAFYAAYLLFTITVVFAGAELFFRYVLGYRTITKGDPSCKVELPDKGYSVYKPNCSVVSKHWEQDDHIRYSFNQHGRRDVEPPVNMTKKLPLVASIGDSFTFGAMVPIAKNYNFRAFYGENSQKPSAILHNYGVSGEQIHNISAKLRTEDFSEYDHILYGLTPNDFFDQVDLYTAQKPNDSDPSKVSLNKSLKKWLYQSALANFASHHLMKNDSTYLNVYLKRKPYSEYLDESLNDKWKSSMESGFEDLYNVPIDVRKKIKIFLLPQKAEVAASRTGFYNNAFTEEFYALCKKFEFDCKTTNIDELADVEQTHFPIDGHLTVEGNKEIARQLRGWSNTWLNTRK